MKIYTKTGDDGTTGLVTGTRVRKDDLRLEAYGTIDELNSYIGLLRDSLQHSPLCEELLEIQHKLFNIGSLLSCDNAEIYQKLPQIYESDIQYLEKSIDKHTEVLPILKKFILPGGSISVSYSHVARTVCRRAERLVIHLQTHTQVSTTIVHYLNRLSDYLFVFARKIAYDSGIDEILWNP